MVGARRCPRNLVGQSPHRRPSCDNPLPSHRQSRPGVRDRRRPDAFRHYHHLASAMVVLTIKERPRHPGGLLHPLAPSQGPPPRPPKRCSHDSRQARVRRHPPPRPRQSAPPPEARRYPGPGPQPRTPVGRLSDPAPAAPAAAETGHGPRPRRTPDTGVLPPCHQSVGGTPTQNHPRFELMYQ